MTSEVIEYRGKKFRRYPNSTRWPDRMYFTPGPADRMKGLKRLHEEIWVDHHGPIPARHHVHHRDGNPLNNEPSNLECLPSAEHMRHHHKGVCSPRKLEHVNTIRPLAAAWHSSPEGLEWHRQHAYKSMLAAPDVEHTCDHCGKSFSTKKKRTNRFCSNACRAGWRRKAGLDDEDRACAVCHTTFRVNRYSKIKTCSRACGGISQSRTKTSKS